MMRSLYSAVSGILAHQKSMDVIGNNIANVNTIGFKQGRAVFKDMFSQTLNPARAGNRTLGGINPTQIGTGVALAAIDNIFSQGTIKATQRALDVAIEGNGFFSVRAKNSATSYYTRAGDFNFDDQGYLTTPTGFVVQGWMADVHTGEVQMNRPVGDVFLSRDHQIMPAKETSEVIYNGVLGTEATASMYTFSKMYTQAAAKQRIFDSLASNGGPTELSSSDSVGIQAHATGVTNAGDLFNKDGQGMALASNVSTITFTMEDSNDLKSIFTYTYTAQSGSDEIPNDLRFTSVQGLLDEINKTLESFGATAIIRNGRIEIEHGDVSENATDFTIKSITSTSPTAYLNTVLSGLTGKYSAGDEIVGTLPTKRVSDYMYYRKIVTATSDFTTFEDLSAQVENAINGNVVSGGFNVVFMENEFGLKDGQMVSATMTFADGSTRSMRLTYRENSNEVPNNIKTSDYIPYSDATGSMAFHTVSELVSALNEFFRQGVPGDPNDPNALDRDGSFELNTTGGADFRTKVGYNTKTGPLLEFSGGSPYLNTIFEFMNKPINSNDPYVIEEISGKGKFSYANVNAGSEVPVGIYGYKDGQQIKISMGRVISAATTVTYTYAADPAAVVPGSSYFNTYEQLIEKLNLEFAGKAVFKMNAAGNLIYNPLVAFNQTTDTLPVLTFEAVNPPLFNSFFDNISKMNSANSTTVLPITYAPQTVLGLKLNEDIVVKIDADEYTLKYVSTVTDANPLDPARSAQFSTLAGLRDRINDILKDKGIGGKMSAVVTAAGGLSLNTTSWLGERYSDINFTTVPPNAVVNSLLDKFNTLTVGGSVTLDNFPFGLQMGEDFTMNFVDGTGVSAAITLTAGTDFTDMASLVTMINSELVSNGMSGGVAGLAPVTYGAGTGMFTINIDNWGTNVAGLSFGSTNLAVQSLLVAGGFAGMTSSVKPEFTRGIFGFQAGEKINVEFIDAGGGSHIITATYTAGMDTTALINALNLDMNNQFQPGGNLKSGLLAGVGETFSYDPANVSWAGNGLNFLSMNITSDSTAFSTILGAKGLDGTMFKANNTANTAIDPMFGLKPGDSFVVTMNGTGTYRNVLVTDTAGYGTGTEPDTSNAPYDMYHVVPGSLANMKTVIDAALLDMSTQDVGNYNTAITLNVVGEGLQITNNLSSDPSADFNVSFSTSRSNWTVNGGAAPTTYSFNDVCNLDTGDTITIVADGISATYTFGTDFNTKANLSTLVANFLSTHGITATVDFTSGFGINVTNWNPTSKSFSVSSSNTGFDTLLKANGFNQFASTVAGTSVTDNFLGLELGEIISLYIDGVPTNFTYGSGAGQFDTYQELQTAIRNALTAAGMQATGVSVSANGISVNLAPNQWGDVKKIGFASNNTPLNTILLGKGMNEILANPKLEYGLLGLKKGDKIQIEYTDYYTGNPSFVTLEYPGAIDTLARLQTQLNSTAFKNMNLLSTITLAAGAGGIVLNAENWDGKPDVTSVEFSSTNLKVNTLLSTVFDPGSITVNSVYDALSTPNIFGLANGQEVTFDLTDYDFNATPMQLTFTEDPLDPGIAAGTHFNSAAELVNLLNDAILNSPLGANYGVFSLSPNATNPVNIQFTSGPGITITVPGLQLNVQTTDAIGNAFSDPMFAYLNTPLKAGEKQITSPRRDPAAVYASSVTGFSIERVASVNDNSFNKNILTEQDADILAGTAAFSQRFLTVATEKTNIRNIFSGAGEYSFFVEDQDFITFSAAINDTPLQGASSFMINTESTIQDMMQFLENFLGLGPDFNSKDNVYLDDGKIVVRGADGAANGISSLIARGFQVSNGDSFESGFGQPLATGAASGGQYVRPMAIYDEQGNAHMVEFEFSMFNSDKNEWALRLNVEDPDVSVKIKGITTNEVIIRFNSNGTPSHMYDRHASPVRIISELKFDLSPGNGARTVKNIKLHIGTPGQRDGLTISNSATTMNIESQDGYELGILSDMLIDENGSIQGYYSNAITRAVGRIAIATFQNNQGLQKVGDTMFRETVSSGMAAIGEAQSGSRGKIASSALEQSNVELSEEFVNMIVTERGFQANSRVVNTSDEMIQELLNLKR